MNPDTEKALLEKHPALFANVGVRGSCMNFGIEVGDGWGGIISSMCAAIGRRPEANVKFDQIKEKWGTLRVYYSGGDDYVAGVVRMAENVSATVCESCGAAGEPRKGGWIKTLCDDCDAEVRR